MAMPTGLCFTDVNFFFICRLSDSKTGGRITTRTVELTLSMRKIITAKNLVNFAPVTPDIMSLICVGGECT